MNSRGARRRPAIRRRISPAWVVIGFGTLANAVAASLRASGHFSTLCAPADGELEQAVTELRRPLGVVFTCRPISRNTNPESARPGLEQLLSLSRSHAATSRPGGHQALYRHPQSARSAAGRSHHPHRRRDFRPGRNPFQRVPRTSLHQGFDVGSGRSAASWRRYRPRSLG